MRYLWMCLSAVLVLLLVDFTVSADINEEDEAAIILEIDGDPQKAKTHLTTYYPQLEIVTVYEELFNGIAIKGDTKEFEALGSLDFIKAIHPVQTYHMTTTNQGTRSPFQTVQEIESDEQLVFPEAANNTAYTGRGVKVGVIDTGIDYDHPDLKRNFQGGYDLVDLDDDPMETKVEEGIPTEHGSHVAGIIAGNGALTGIAPEADIYAYRALGPGGMGTSIQIIAAMEQALRDGMDVMNLSLGNDVNGPDYPTSVAVNRAREKGAVVVIANGNSGPEDWTVGSPATATHSFSVGATEQEKQIPYLHEPREDKLMALEPFIGSVAWNFSKDYPITGEDTDLQGKIALMKRGEAPFYELAKEAENSGAAGVLIYNNTEEAFQGMVASEDDPVTIPVAQISKAQGEWLTKQTKQNKIYVDTKYKKQPERVAPFSSRGPVTINWEIKPDILAPGTDIISTVPGGYQVLQGTSMAAPYVSGAIALLKEARPKWSNEQIIGALKTTAQQIQNENEEPVEATDQGLGRMDPGKAIDTSTIIYNPALSFGTITKKEKKKTTEVTIENTTSTTQTYRFFPPKRQSGIRFQLPNTITLDKNEKKTFPIQLNTIPGLLEEGIHQGWITMEGEEETYHLPYLFIHDHADQPMAMGFDFSLKTLSEDVFSYQLYITEEAKSVDVTLYHPSSLMYETQLLSIDDPVLGLNEGEIPAKQLEKTGSYLAMVTVELANGEYESYQSMVYIEEDPSENE